MKKKKFDQKLVDKYSCKNYNTLKKFKIKIFSFLCLLVET